MQNYTRNTTSCNFFHVNLMKKCILNATQNLSMQLIHDKRNMTTNMRLEGVQLYCPLYRCDQIYSPSIWECYVSLHIRIIRTIAVVLKIKLKMEHEFNWFTLISRKLQSFFSFNCLALYMYLKIYQKRHSSLAWLYDQSCDNVVVNWFDLSIYELLLCPKKKCRK